MTLDRSKEKSKSRNTKTSKMIFSGKFNHNLLAVCMFIYVAVTDAGQWSYEGHTGPKNWHTLFPEKCSGRKQSPININTLDTIEDPGLKDFALWYDPPKPGSKFIMHNNGHTVQVDTEGEFYVTNGGLPNVYATKQFHFHWGHHKVQGSEHKIDGKAAPIELHIVNFNIDRHDTIVEALTVPQGLAVLGVMFEVSDRDNPVLEPLILNMNRVKDPELKKRIEIPALPIRDFLPEDTTRYFRYNGSLTTPGCFESVIWTLFADRQTISHRQLMKFRRLLKPAHERRHHHNHKHRRMRRNEPNTETAAETVLEEIGIKDNVKEETELMETMMKNNAHGQDHTTGNNNEMKPTLGETSKKFHLYDDESPNLDKNKPIINGSAEVEEHKKHEDHAGHGGHDAEVTVETEEEWVELDWDKFGIVPDNLVNNFRPVQPLNDRKILRSFPLEKIKESKVAYKIEEDTESDNKNYNNNNGALGSSAQLSIFILAVNILYGVSTLL
ncbi:hypothetical protein KUTeg_004819 [Tegillarca granosa]|uniref:Alpha-carbonic anhydrase domain-containing protein n=1 Tax=Tegillarca granosa TaxID=220873 RepID=A0ABQ9FKW5_TEGGR|nr:hypothetical protein KUTeg_004819 [Tegillarca granosa]